MSIKPEPKPKPFFTEITKEISSWLWLPQLNTTQLKPYNLNSDKKGATRNWFTTLASLVNAPSVDTKQVAEEKEGASFSLAGFLFRYCRDKEGHHFDDLKAQQTKKPKSLKDVDEFTRDFCSNPPEIDCKPEDILYIQSRLFFKGLQELKDKVKVDYEDKQAIKKREKEENPDVLELEREEKAEKFSKFLDETKKKRKTCSTALKQVKSKKKQKLKKEQKQPKKRAFKKSTKVPANKCHKIRVFPTKEQKSIFKQWVGGSRWIYNHCVLLVKHQLRKPTLKDLRACFQNPEAVQATLNCLNNINGKSKRSTESKTLKKEQDKKEHYVWLFKIPAKLRDQAIMDFINNMKSAKASHKNDQKKSNFKFRSLKDNKQSVIVPCQNWGSEPRKDNELALGHLFSHGKLSCTCHDNDKIPKKLDYDSRFVRTRDGKFYLCVNTYQQPVGFESENQALEMDRKPRAIVLDPGVRAFQTAYDPDGHAFQWGNNDMQRICKLGAWYNKLQSEITKTEVKGKRYRMRKAARRIQQKIRNLVDELHKKLALFLCRNYQVIILPEFNCKNMAKRWKRKINRKTVRSMLTWSHYRFRQRLLNKQKEFSWCRVILCDEAYTSKTCGNCGHIHNKLGGNKIFKCPNCKQVSDRDIHAARNILLRVLTLLKVETPELSICDILKSNVKEFSRPS